jgi:hypothetical protein
VLDRAEHRLCGGERQQADGSRGQDGGEHERPRSRRLEPEQPGRVPAAPGDEQERAERRERRQPDQRGLWSQERDRGGEHQ